MWRPRWFREDMSQSLPSNAADEPFAVALDGISRTYRSGTGKVHALSGVTHVFSRGTFTAVMGPSGSGKSTLLQIAAGLDRPTRGGVTIAGTAWASSTRRN